MAVFIVLCEGFLGISPHFNLWRHFFAITLQKKMEKSGRQELHMPMGCAGIQLRNNRVGEYRPCGSRRPTRGDTRSGSTSRMPQLPLCQSSLGA